MVFLFTIKLNYAAYGTIPIILLFIYLSISKKYRIREKSILAVVAITTFYTFTFVLYGKSLNFILINYLSTIALLITMRSNRLIILFSSIIVSIVSVTIYFDFFGYDLGNKNNFERDIYNPLFYFVVLMISVYIIILLMSRTKAISSIIKDLKYKNFELEESRIKLKKMQLNKESFFAIMSHEIRTPLNAIKGISDILKNDQVNEENYKLLELMDYSANHLLALVNNILDFTKLNDGAFTLQHSEFNLNKSLQSIFKMNERVAHEKGLEYILDIPDSIPSTVYGDKNRIDQIILNLLNNALEHTETGFVKLKIRGDYPTHNSNASTNVYTVRITVEDTGKGINKALQKKLFEKYNTSSASKNSVGLGLTISKGLVELMNGSITYKSKINKGTKFTVILPLPLNEQNTHIENTVEVKTQLSNLKILLVDDNKINLLILEKQLINNLTSSFITLAHNGLEAVNLVKANNFDLVLMDIVMPVMDGITATTTIRNIEDNDKKNIPIIALTANVGENEFQRCIQAGMNKVLTKPFEIVSLIKVISKEIEDYKAINSKKTTAVS
jgi:signal transduction histidine kinase/AmiR/NasT family two-component response regulator